MIIALVETVRALRGRAAASLAAVTLTPARRRRRRTLTAMSAARPLTVFLAPEAGLEPFYASHVILARVLQDAGQPVLILSCNGLQPTCSLKAAMQIKPTRPGDSRNNACARCRLKAIRVGAEYGLPDIPLEDLLDGRSRAEIERVVAANAAAPWDAVYDGIKIGAGCLGDAFRETRKVAVDEFDDTDIALVQSLLYSTLAIYLAVKELGKRFAVGRIAYFGDYSFFLPPQIYARRNGIPLTNVCHGYHRDTDRRFLNLWPTHAAAHQLEQVKRWEQYQGAAIDPHIIAEIADGALYRLQGHGGVSTYSPNWSENPGNLLGELGLKPGGKLLVAYTNSTDEFMGHQQALRTLDQEYDISCNPFATQIEWLRHLITWIRNRDDLRLIVRLHPRMAVSARHPSVASEYRLIKELFAILPSNVAVVWPESPISSYNIAELAEVALTAWSSIGLELARFGLPVIAAFSKVGAFPNSAFIRFERTADGYFMAIDQALAQLASLESILGAFRWTHFLHWTPLIDIADVVPQPDYPSVPPFHTPRNADKILDVMIAGTDIVALNMARQPTGPTAAAMERAAVISAVERFARFFMTGCADSNAMGDAPAEFILAEDGSYTVTMTIGDRTIRRHSPLAARLVRILHASQISAGA